MRRIITTGILALAISCLALSAQTQKTDLELDNLKGNVSKVSAFKRTVIEEWGEEKEVLTSIYCSYYNEKGFFTFRRYKLDEDPSYFGGATKRYEYDASGRLSQVLYYLPKTNNDIISIDTNAPQVKAVYEYDGQGRIRYISYYQTESSTWQMSSYYRYGYYRGREIDTDDHRYEAKEIWVYTADGYKHSICDKDGKTLKKEVYTENGKMMEDEWGLSVFDNAGRLIARGGTITANNGAVSYGYYYGYNKQGDLAIESKREVGQKEIEIMPWLSAEYNYHGDHFYEYTYDVHGNWIERKKFKTLNGNRKPELEEDIVRKIEYGQYGALNNSSISGMNGSVAASPTIVIGEAKMSRLADILSNGSQAFTDFTSEIDHLSSEYEKNKDKWTAAIRESKAAQLAQIKEQTGGMLDEMFMSTVQDINYQIFDNNEEFETAEDAMRFLKQTIQEVESAYPGSPILPPMKSIQEKYESFHKEP